MNMIRHYAGIQATLHDAERLERAERAGPVDEAEVEREVEQVSTSYAPSAPTPDRHPDAPAFARAIHAQLD
jgi:hypothetical protein